MTRALPIGSPIGCLKRRSQAYHEMHAGLVAFFLEVQADRKTKRERKQGSSKLFVQTAERKR